MTLYRLVDGAGATNAEFSTVVRKLNGFLAFVVLLLLCVYQTSNLSLSFFAFLSLLSLSFSLLSVFLETMIAWRDRPGSVSVPALAVSQGASAVAERSFASANQQLTHNRS